MSEIIAALHRHAVTMPDAIAVGDSRKKIVWAELARDVSATAEWIMREGYRRVGFELDNGFEWILLDLAALQAGVDTVPIPTFFSDAQVKHILDDAGVDCYVTDRSRVRAACREEREAIAVPSHDRLIGHVRRFGGRRIEPVAGKITYTSGSTGDPKGVCLSNETIEKVTCGIVEALAPVEIERHLCVLPLSTLLENIAGLYAPLVKGIEIVVPDPADVGLDGVAGLDVEKFAACIDSVRPDSMILVPQLLVALTALTGLGMIDAASLKMVAVGGGNVSRRLLEEAMKLSIPVYEGYGLSECCSVVTLNLPGAHRLGSAGKALPHAAVRINDCGEVEVAGVLMTGYLHDAPVGESWYPTGDLGHLDEDGFLYVSGRKRNMFITTWGRNVNPEWVEAELAQKPAISQVLVAGEGRPHNLALIWPRFESSRDDLARLVAEANEQLPDYARIHEWIVMSEPLPVEAITANGRLKRDVVTSACRDVIESHYTNQ